MVKIASVGLGTAGITFISELLRLKVEADITVFEKRGAKIFHPCSIPEAIEGKISLEKLIEPARFSGIKIIEGEVKKAEADDGTVFFVCKDGESLKEKKDRFDFIFVGTGGETVLPCTGEKIFKATKYDDVVRIMKVLDSGPRKIAVVGAGVLGLEIASALSKYAHVDVFDMGNSILPGFLDPRISTKIAQEIESSNNVKFHLSYAIENPHDIDADLIVFCTGFRPVNIFDVPIEVDTTMRVVSVVGNIPLFSAGDCVDSRKNIPRVAPVAAEQARVAARNIKAMIDGQDLVEKYNGMLAPCIIKAFGYEIGKVGILDLEEEKRKEAKTFILDVKVLPFNDEKMKVCITVDRYGNILELQAVSSFRSEVRHILDIFYIAIKRGMKIDEIRRLELSYQPEICTFPDPVTSVAEVVSRRIGKL